MPFAVFRKHQRKLLAVFAITAMFGFVISDSVPRLLNSDRAAAANPVIVESLYGGKVRQSDLVKIADQRSKANRFMFPIRYTPTYFGGLSQRELVDALILEHEADRLGLPADTDLARKWLTRETNGLMNKTTFDSLLAQLGGDVGGEEILIAIAAQLRLREARLLLGSPPITPLDTFEEYRNQNERSSFKLAAFPVANYIDKVAEPSDAEVKALFNGYKDILPDPAKDTPGFKEPRRVKLEILTADGSALAKQIQDKLTDAEIRAYYETRKTEYVRFNEFPADVFKGDPEAKLTPPVYQSYDELKELLAGGLARDRAAEQITEKFNRLKDEVIDDFSDKYHDVLAELDESRRSGEVSRRTLPTPTSLKEVAAKEALQYEETPLLAKDEAAHFGTISGAVVGSSYAMDSSEKFSDVVFDQKSLIFDSLEFTDISGRRYLARKTEDVAAHTADFDRVKADVVRAWKSQKAREFAEKAAGELLAKVKADGGQIKDGAVPATSIIAIDGVTKMRAGMPIPNAFFQFGPPSPTELPQIPFAGDALRDAMFGMKTGEAFVQPDAPKHAYYVVTLTRRDPVGFASFSGPSGSSLTLLSEAMQSAFRVRDQAWMRRLRTEAGLSPDWKPADEKERDRDGEKSDEG